MSYKIIISRPAISDENALIHTRKDYGDALDLFRKKCSTYAAHAAILSNGSFYTITLLAASGGVIQELNIHSVKHYEHE